MRLTIVGRATTRASEFVAELLCAWKPEHLITVQNISLGAEAARVAREIGIPVSNFTKGVVGGMNLKLEDAAHQAVAAGKPDLLICLAPRKWDHIILRVFRQLGIKCVLGEFGKDREVTWVRL